MQKHVIKYITINKNGGNTMEDLFKSLEKDNSVEVVQENQGIKNEVKDSNKAKRQEKVKMFKDSMNQTLQENPEYLKNLRTLSPYIEVVNSLGYGDKGNILLDRDKTDSSGKRKLQYTSAIVGYKVKNNSQQTITYETETYMADENGKYIPTVVEKTFAPGEEICIARAYMTKLCARPEISFTLGNGKLVRSSANATDFRSELEAYYFTFSDEENKQINDDSVKLNVAEQLGDKWVVKPEYLEIFGYLNNPSEKASKTKGARNNLTTQDYAANFIFRRDQEKKKQNM